MLSCQLSEEVPSKLKSHCKVFYEICKVESDRSRIKWAAEASIQRFFPSEYGTDIEHNTNSPDEKPHQLKLKVRAYAKTITSVKFTYLVTGPYPDMFIAKSGKKEIGSFDVKAKEATLLGDGNAPIAFTSMIE